MTLMATRGYLPATTPYREFLAWLSRQDAEAARVAWRDYLADLEEGTSLAPPQRQDITAPGDVYLEIEEAQTAQLFRLAREQGCTLSTVLQAVVAIVLSRLTARRDVVFGLTVAGRPPEIDGIESMIGLFINTVPVRARLRPNETLRDLLERVQRSHAAVLPYHYLALTEIQRAGGIGELFDTLLVLENYPTRADSSARSGHTRARLASATDSSHYPLSVVVGPGARLKLRLSYQPGCFERAAVEQVAARLARVLAVVARDVVTRVCDVDVLTDEERREVLVDWSAAARPRTDKTIHTVFERQTRHHPDAVAVVSASHHLTYAALDRRAEAIASLLRAHRAGPDRVVAIAMRRSPALIAAALGVVKAGAAYLPLDVEAPAQRLAATIEVARAIAVLTSGDSPIDLPSAAVPVLCVDHDGKQFEGSSDGAAAKLGADNLAYVIFTSGSTGEPKGVMCRHRGVVNLAAWQAEQFGVRAGSRVAQMFPFAFDGALGEMAMALLNGATLVMIDTLAHAPDQLLDLLRREVDVVVTVPSLLSRFEPESAAEELQVVSVGEACPPDLAARWARACRFMNVYGPTE